MELDDIDPASWAALESAADDYIAAHDADFDAAARALCHNAGAGSAFDPAQERLGAPIPPFPLPSPHSCTVTLRPPLLQLLKTVRIALIR